MSSLGANCIVLFAACHLEVAAATFIWKLGSGGGVDPTHWSNPKNWNPGNGPPAATDDASFGNVGSLSPTLTANTSVNSITFDVTAQSYTVGGAFTLTIGAGGIVQNSNNAQILNPTVALGANQTWNIGGGGLTANGIISGAFSLTKSGSGTLTLDNNNTYSGGTIIDSGTVAVSSNTRLGSTSGGVTFGGGTLRLLGAVTTARNMTLNAGSGSLDHNGFDATWSGAISGSGNLTKLGLGTLTLSGNNIYTGNLIVQEGIVLANSTRALGDPSGIQLNGGTLRLGAVPSFSVPPPVTFAGGTLDANNQNATFGSLILDANSTVQLDASQSPSVTITFTSASISGSPTLTITGWSEASNRDKIIINSTPSSSFLAAIQFSGFPSGGAMSGTELVPVPEPAEITLASAVILLGFGLARRYSGRAKAITPT